MCVVRPIVLGVRGPAVEDVQQRLLVLGHDLGSTGIDGVFLGKTYDAVRDFQRAHGLSEDGVVGHETWSALVDATFTLGDRMLYLRLPHFHGRDVQVLQEALNALGFASGPVDAIFGAYTERAVREFQRNCGQPADGVVGLETVRTLMGLRHIWEGKDSNLPLSASLAPARVLTPLLSTAVIVTAQGAFASEVAKRLVNLAKASHDAALVSMMSEAEEAGDRRRDAGLTLMLAQGLDDDPDTAVTVLGDDDPAAFHSRLLAALTAMHGMRGSLVIDLGRSGDGDDEKLAQRAAVRLLDALCAVLA